MKDYRKFCRPKTTKYPQIGDVQVKLNCGSIVYVKAKDYQSIKKSFKINSIVGETSNTAGNIKVLDKELNKEIIVSPETYASNQNKFELIEIVDNITNAQDGDIICHNTILNQDAIFSYNDWLNLDDSWDAIGLYGIETFDNDDEVTEDRYIIMANGTTFIIKTTDYSKVSNEFEIVDTIDVPVTDYIDLGLPSGTLWAKGNIVADGNSYKVGEETDYGAYVSWGNVTPHFSTNGSTFDDSYDFGTSNSGPYAQTPGASIQFTSDTNGADFSPSGGYDAARELLGGNWRMPTATEFKELYDNTDNEWTTINGVAGRKFMKKSDHSVYVFFPAAGRGYGTSLTYRGAYGYYWSSSLNSADYGYYLYFLSSNVYPQSYDYRSRGVSVRAVQSLN